MKKLLLLVGFCLALTSVFAQTSWKGTVSTSWSNASNWTNGVPNSTKAAVLGDASFTGSFQPKVGTTAACAGLTLGGNRVCTLTLSRNLTIAGNLLVNGGSGQQAGHISQGKVSMSVTGNITINGTYAPSHNSANIIFSGTAQTFTTTPNTFRKVTVNANSVVTVNSSFAPAGTFSVAGTLNPLAGVTIGGAPAVKSTGTLKVNATNFANNYSGTATLSAGSTVDYCATANQNVAALNYSLLRISGSGTKTVVAAITISSASSAYGSVNVAAGTLDLGTMTLNRNASGAGTFSVANGATLRVGDASNFPASFLSYSLPLNSTVEYYRANNQTVAGGPTYGNLSYGNLILSGSGTKTLPSSATTVTGALTLNGSVTAQASANLTVTGVTTLSAGTTLNGGTFTIQTGNNVVNDGTINGNTGTFNLAGAGATVSSTASGVFNFNNLSILASGTSSAVPTINVSGNLATTGSGVFTHSSGTIVMTGAGKTISGSGLTLNNLTVNGTGTTAAGMTLSGNLAVSGGLSTSDVLVMNGSSKTISGAGTISFATLSATGTISTATNFTVTNTLDVTGGFTASAGTATFSGTTLFNGSANLFNVTLGSTSSLQLAANSSMGIGGALTVPAGATFNATTTTPNTVSYNSTGAQNVTGVTYDNLVLTGGNTKTSTGAFITNTDLTIASGTTFAAATFTDSIKGNWNNNGIFNAGSSTIALAGPNDATITGATSFATLTVNKSSSTNSVFLSSNVTTPTLNMTNGILRTGSNKVTITGTRTGNGYIYGTIERSHAFSSATNYAFEGPDNYINFTGASGITGVTMVVSQGSVSGFPFGAAINRSYTISLASGSYTSALLRLHYEDAEKNGNDESNLKLYRYNGSSWTDKGVSGSNTTTNYAEQTAATPDLAGTWTLSTTSTVLTWTGAQSTDWATAANWNVSGGGNAVPTAADIVQIGTIAYGANHPLVTSAAVAKSIQFGSAQAAILNLGTNGSLSTQGNISGSWSANATHTINTNGQNLTVNGGLVLSDGSTGHAINLNIGTGTVALTGSLTQGGGAAIAFTGAGNLKIGGDFTYTSGTFTAGSGTVTYNGGNFQSVGGVTYNQLIIDKTAATATTNPLATTTVTGNLTVKAGTFDFSGPTIIAGDVTVNSGAFATNRTTIAVGGNWNNNGTYIPNGGAATFNGTGAQSVSSTSFNKIIVNKPSGVLSLAGNITLNSDFLINAGTVNLGTFTANRNTIGGTFQLDNSAALQLSGSNFPLNYTYYTFGTSSTTTYNGTVAQSVGGITYGHLVMTNSGTKTLAAPATVGGNLTINSGATLDGSSHNLTIAGNWVNGGTFTPSTGAVLATGTGKTITGATTFNKLTVYGSYSIINGTATTYNGALTIVSGGSYDAGSGLAVLYGNLSNSGSLTSNGTTTFMGTAVQTLQLLNAINSTSTGIINFNGSVAPVLNSTSTPTFATLNINNTAGVSPSVNWTIGVALNIAAGSSFKGGAATHTILGDFNNLGVVTSTGGLVFAPRSSATANLGANSGGNTFSSDGTVTFSGTGALTVSGTPTKLTNVSIGNSNGVSPSSNWSSVLGTFTVADTAVFNAGANTYTLSGDLESNGRINPGTSHFLFIGAAPEVSGSPNTTFYDVTVNTGAVMLISSEFNVSRHMNINGSIDVNSTASFIMTGSTAANLTGTPTSLALTDFEVAKTNATVTLQKPITGSQSITVSGGTLDIGANTVGVDATNSPNNTLSISDGARLRIGGTSALPAYDAFALDSLSVVEYYGTGTQALTPSALYGSLEITAGTKTTSAALTIQKNVLLSTGTFTAGNFTHSVGGDWTQTSGTFTPGTGTIVFNGTGPQTVGATDAFNNITINNASNVSLGTLLKVNGVVDFTAGKLVLGSNNLLPGSITNATSARYIVATGSGVLRQPLAASASKAFPVGTATNYIPATVAFAAGSTADSISVRVLTATYNNGETGSALTNYAVNASWIIDEKVAGGSNASITLQWPAALELPLFSRNTCRLAHYTGGAWNYGVSSLSATGSDPYSVTRSGFTSFSPFSVRMNNAVLPVTFVSFSGQRRGGNDHLTWSTASESNSARFEVEESSDGRSFRAIGTVAAAGSSSTLRTYNYGNNGVQGTRYYRIRQVDLDGRFTYTNVVRLTDDASAVSVRLGANPVPGNTTLQLQVPVATRVQLSLHDGAGRIVWNSSPALGAGSQTIALPTAPLAAGLYYLGIRFEDGSVQTIKLVKE